MARRARGIDNRPVVTEHDRKSVSRERTFRHDLKTLTSLKRVLWRLSRSVAQRLERERVEAETIAIKLRYHDFETLTRQTTLGVPTRADIEIYGAALALMTEAWERGRPVRLLGVGGYNLSPPTGQLRLPLFRDC